MNRRLRPPPLLFALPVALGVGIVLAVVAWTQGVVPWAEARISRSTGHKAKIGSLIPRLRRLEARDVVLFGAPPFEGAPLARIARLDIQLSFGGAGGGSLFAPAPTHIKASGALVTYLAVGVGPGAVDNLRGVAGTEAATAATRARASTATLELTDSRFEAHVRLPALGENRGFSLRAEGLSGGRGPDGQITARFEGAVFDVPGWTTVRLPRVDLAWAAGKGRISGRDVAVAVPGGGPLLGPAAIELRADAGRLTIDATPARADAAGTREPGGRLQARLQLAPSLRPRGELRLEGVPLPALAPLATRFGVTLTHGTGDLVLDLAPGPEAQAAPTASPLQATLTLGLRHLDVHHPRLDRAPWRGMSVSARVRGSYDAGARALALADGTLEALGVKVRVAGRVQLRPLAVDIDVLPAATGPSPCADALGEWPAPVREKLTGLTVAGKLGPRAHLVFDERRWEQLQLEVAFAPLCEVRSEPLAIARLDPSAAPEVFVANAVRPLGVAPADVVTLRSLPPHVIGAFLTAEDAAFRRHDGLDLEMIRRALAHDLAMGSLSKGASTLTQQVVKNLFLTPERTLGRKLAELVLTWRIEQRLDKDHILELYLNAVELGPGIRGLGRAATVYFGKPARQLTPLEAAHLAALLPNPIGFARRFRDGRVDDGWMLKLLDLLGRMRRSGWVSQASLEGARGTSLNLRKF